MTTTDRVIAEARRIATRDGDLPPDWRNGGALAWTSNLACWLARHPLAVVEEMDLAAAIAFVIRAEPSEGERLIDELRRSDRAQTTA